MSALDSNQTFGFALLQPIGMGDLNTNSATPRGLNPGASVWTHTPWGLLLVRYVQNRDVAVVKGALMSAVGDVNGKTQITSSGAAAVNTTTKITTSGLTASAHVGGGAYILNNTTGTGTAPEGEDSIVVSNSTTEVIIDARHPYSATTVSGDTINLYGTYNSQLSADGDQAFAVQGVVMGKDGITAGNFGFVARNGYVPNTLLKAATALTQSDALVADAGRVGPAAGSADVALLQIGTAPHVVNDDIVTDKTSVYLILGPGFNPGTVDASA